MTNTQKIAASVVIVVAVTATAVKVHEYNTDLYGRFPELDRKVVRKAFRKMMAKSLRGELTDAQTANDDTMDATFLRIVCDMKHAKK